MYSWQIGKSISTGGGDGYHTSLGEGSFHSPDTTAGIRWSPGPKGSQLFYVSHHRGYRIPSFVQHAVRDAVPTAGPFRGAAC
jgi:hypothetical protein